MSSARIPVVFDCDNTFGLPGHDIDDGLTLFYLLGRPDIDLLGVTLVHGNSSLANVIETTERLLGETGLQDRVKTFSGDAAARFLAESADTHPGTLRVLATGAQSNLAAANAHDPQFYNKVAEIFLMGGVTGPLSLHGVDVIELNFSADASAALNVLTSAAPITLLNAHTTAEAVFGAEDIARLEATDTPLARYLSPHVTAWANRCNQKFGVYGFCNWDMAAAIAISHPELFVQQTVTITPTRQTLQTGDIGLSDTGKSIQMPSGLRDLAQFNSVIFDAWATCESGLSFPNKSTR